MVVSPRVGRRRSPTFGPSKVIHVTFDSPPVNLPVCIFVTPRFAARCPYNVHQTRLNPLCIMPDISRSARLSCLSGPSLTETGLYRRLWLHKNSSFKIADTENIAVKTFQKNLQKFLLKCRYISARIHGVASSIK